MDDNNNHQLPPLSPKLPTDGDNESFDRLVIPERQQQQQQQQEHHHHNHSAAAVAASSFLNSSLAAATAATATAATAATQGAMVPAPPPSMSSLSTTTSAHSPQNISSSSVNKPNWHARTISWGKDSVLGPEEEIVFSSNSNSNKDNASTSHNNSDDNDDKEEEVNDDDDNDEEEDDENARQAKYIQSLFAGAPPRRHKTSSNLANIDLADIIKESPMEHEAETYILRAIEEREQYHYSRHESAATFPQISDDAISALSTNADDDDGNDDDPAAAAAAAAATGANPATPTPTTGSNTTPVTVPLVARHRRANSRGIHLNRDAQQHHQHHRRNQTMEQQLWGLTSAIDALHTHDDSNTSSEFLFGATLLGEPETSVKALERNAQLLVHRGGGGRRGSLRHLFPTNNNDTTTTSDPSAHDDSIHKKPTFFGSSSGGDASTSSNSGNKRLRNLMHYKKTDGDDADDNDNDNPNSNTPESTGDSVSPDPSSINNVTSTLTEPSEHLADIEEGAAESGSDNEMGHKTTTATESIKTKTTTTTAANRDDNNTKNKQNNRKTKRPSTVRELQDFFAPQRTTIVLYFRVVFLYLAMPLLGIAAILFYLADNPGTGRLANGGRPDANGTLWYDNGNIVPASAISRTGNQLHYASISWWLIFVVRQLVTFTVAKVFERIFVDYLTIRSKSTIHVFGPWMTLFILQSRGWPSTLSLWAIINFCFLAGPTEFAQHWLYWQDDIGLFSLENPAGNVVNSSWNIRILAIALVLGIIVSLKRLLLGFHLGKRTFNAYADQLANIMQNILMISEVAALAKDFEREMRIRANRKGVTGTVQVAQMSAQREKLFDIFDDLDEDGASAAGGGGGGATFSGNSTAEKSFGRGPVVYIIDPEDRNPWSGVLSYTQQQRIIQLLGAWEEPVIAEKQVEEIISVSALLQFRRSMAMLNTPTPFGGAFGLADTREHCIQSAQDLYRRLLLNEPDQQELNFETLALLGLKSDGTLDQPKLKDIIRLVRPDRDGSLDILHFVKSIDTVYKEIRLLRASVTNTSRIDKSFETIVNWIFYSIALTIILSQLGFSPMALFLSISGVILAFAFMIGSASSKYFEGLLFILVRRPYAIGDGIHVMGIESEGMYTGHPFWYVEDVTLFTTSVLYMYTGERATLSNGSLANSRIVNSSRSPQAWMYTLLKFPVDVSHEKMQIFNTALEQFFRNRPREWRSYDSFRATRFDAEAGFIEYMVVATHRNSWYDWTTIHVSKADMIHFCMELSKQLDIFYRTPPMPVDLTIKQGLQQHLIPPFAPIPGGPQTDGHAGAPLSNDNLGPLTGPQHPDLTHLQSMFPPRMS